MLAPLEATFSSIEILFSEHVLEISASDWPEQYARTQRHPACTGMQPVTICRFRIACDMARAVKRLGRMRVDAFPRTRCIRMRKTTSQLYRHATSHHVAARYFPKISHEMERPGYVSARKRVVCCARVRSLARSGGSKRGVRTMTTADDIIPSDPTQALVLATARHEQALATIDEKERKRRGKWPEAGIPKKGKRFGPPDDKPYKPLPYVELPVGLGEEEIDQFLREQRLEDLHRKISLHQLEDVDPDIRPPSPPPVYDRQGNRLNTREVRIKKAMLAEYNRLIRYMIKTIPGYHPPEGWRPQKLIKKIIIPYEKYPQAPFMGVIIGARGVNHKRLQEATGCKIFIRGRDIGDRWQTDEEQQMPSHVHIEGDTEEQIEAADKLLQPLLNPESPEFEYARTNGMQQIATVNGFKIKSRENQCSICQAIGHLSFECPDINDLSYKMANISCAICGDKGHIAADCLQLAEQHKKDNVDWKEAAEKKWQMDEEYENLMSELGESVETNWAEREAGAAAAKAVGAMAPQRQLCLENGDWKEQPRQRKDGDSMQLGRPPPRAGIGYSPPMTKAPQPPPPPPPPPPPAIWHSSRLEEEALETGMYCPPHLVSSWAAACTGISQDCGSRLLLQKPGADRQRQFLVLACSEEELQRAMLHIRAWLDVHTGVTPMSRGIAACSSNSMPAGFPPGMPPGFPPLFDGAGILPGFPPGFPPAMDGDGVLPGFPPGMADAGVPLGFPPGMNGGGMPAGFPPGLIDGGVPLGFPPSMNGGGVSPGFPPGMTGSGMPPDVPSWVSNSGMQPGLPPGMDGGGAPLGFPSGMEGGEIQYGIPPGMDGGTSPLGMNGSGMPSGFPSTMDGPASGMPPGSSAECGYTGMAVFNDDPEI